MNPPSSTLHNQTAIVVHGAEIDTRAFEQREDLVPRHLDHA